MTKSSNKSTGDNGKLPAFRKDSKDFKKMLQLIEKGKIKPTDKPSAIKTKYAKYFWKYSDGSFRSQFNNAKGMAGISGKGKYS